MSMKYLAAYALVSLTKPSPTQADIEAVCKSVNISVDKNDLAFVFEAIAQRDVATLIAEGASKMSTMAAPAAGGAASTAGGAAPAAAAAGKKEEKVEEEEDDEMGFGLFD